MTGQESDDEQEPVGSARVTQARAAGVLVIGQIAATLADVLTPLVLVRYLEREELGLLGGLLLVYQTTTMVVASGIPRSVLYFLPGRERAVRAAIAWRLSGMLATAAGVIAAVCMLSFAIWQGLFGAPVAETSLLPWLPLLACWIACDIPTRMLPNVLVTEGLARSSAAVSVIRSVGSGAAVLCPAMLGLGVGAIAMAMAGWSVVYLGWCAWLLLRVLRPQAVPDDARIPTVRDILRFSIPVGATDVINVVNKGVDRFLIMGVFPAAVWAEYQVGAWQIPVISTVAWSVGAVQMPTYRELAERGELSEILGQWRQSVVKVSLVVVPVAMACMFAAGPLIRVLFTSVYESAVPVFVCYTAMVLGRVAFYGAPVLAMGRPDLVMSAAGFTLLSNLAFSVPLLWWVGSVGPAAGSALGMAAAMVVYCYFIGLVLQTPWHRVFPIGGWLRVVGWSTIAGGTGYLAQGMLQLSDAAALPFQLVITLVMYSVIATLAGDISSADWRFVREWLTLRVLRSPSRANQSMG
jgi:O-antigen/teichoic acid export membrane protein